MLGTFGLRPKATLRARALAMAQSLSASDWSFELITTPWDFPSDAGRAWSEDGIPVRNTRTVRPLAFPLATLETTRRVRQTRPDLIHLFKPKGFGDLSARVLRRLMPVVVDMDDWEGNGGWNEIGGYPSLQRHLFDWQERTWPRRAAALTVASRTLEQRALELGASPSRVHYIPNGLTRQRFTQLTSVDRPPAGTDEPPIILLYTRFVEFKPELIAQLLVFVREAFPGALVRIVGASADGRPETELRRAARAAGVGDAIDWHGWAGQDEISQLAAACDVAVHPFDDNLVNRAKCSVKLLELMATGIPVVTTSVGENASFIQNGVSGILVQPGEVAALAIGVIEVLRNRDLADRLGKAARERVNACFLWEQLAPRVADAYRQALDEREARSTSI
ncbi:MAG TPA: glycosyltransferase family 4 protein [Nitrolancea sp.]|jgi:glycosyltransferase involved in cell wall biosynthesis|nr:glycosyltransferase family 4 protein [Nitrolancea sp.]